MKKIIILLIFMFLFSKNINNIAAQATPGCSDLVITDIVGDPPYSYKLGAINCNPEYSYSLIITDGTDIVTQLDMNSSDGTSWSTQFPFSARPKNYTAYLVAVDDIPDNPSDPNNPPPSYEKWEFPSGPPAPLTFTVNQRPEDEEEDPYENVVVTIENCGTDDDPGIGTAIGCIFFGNPISIASSLIVISFGVAGGVALLLTAYAAFQIMTSAGNPTQLRSAQELLVAAIGGILIMTLSTLIMRVFGVDILNLF